MEFYDIVTKRVFSLEGKTMKQLSEELGLSRWDLVNFKRRKSIMRYRYVKTNQEYKTFTLVDFDTGEEFECLTPNTMSIYLNQKITNGECSIINDLRFNRVYLGSIGGKVFKLKNGKKRPITRSLRNQTPKCLEAFAKKDMERKIIANQRRRLIHSIKRVGAFKCKPSLDLIGCSVRELKKYLEDKFLPGMTWNNYGYRGWHVDHIIPISSFNLLDEEEQKKCFHYTNLQPMWGVDNFAKGRRLPS